MNFDEWLTTIPIKQTPKGARLDLRLYVYPDGHGNFLIAGGNGPVNTEGQPVNNPAEARDVLEKLWTRAMNLESESDAAQTRQPTIAEQFADVIGTVPDLPEDMATQHDRHFRGKYSRIKVDPDKMGGAPCIRDLRIPVASVVGMVADQMTLEEILSDYPDLEAGDIWEALRFAAETVLERELPLVNVS